MLTIKAVLICVLFLCFTSIEGYAEGYTYYSSLHAQLKLHTEPADWQAARIKCHDEGAILAAPWNDQFWSLLLDEMQLAIEDLTIYAGVQEHFPEGIYRYINRKQILSRKLQDIVDLARCVVYHSNGTRELGDCRLPFAYICQAPVAQTVECGEFDFELNSKTGSCYKFHENCKTWDNAYKTCQEEGAYLAIINSETEVGVLSEMCASHPWEELRDLDDEVEWQEIAVGFYYWQEADTYITIQGESIEKAGFANWSSENLSSRGKSGIGGAMTYNGLLDVIEKSKRLPFICEKKPVQPKTKNPFWSF